MAVGEGAVTLKLRKGDEQKLNAALEVFAKRAEINKPEVLIEAGHKGASHCRKKCPVDKGHLRASIGIPAKEGIFELAPQGMIFGTAKSYALAVEEGSKPHIIPVGEKGFLAWKGGAVAQKISFGNSGIIAGKMQYRTKKGNLSVDRGRGEWIYTKKPVKHPGTKGQHFMLRGVEQAVPEIVDILSGIIR